MTEMEYRVTNHDWYAIVRSFIILGLAFLFVSVFSIATGVIDPMWLHFTTGGTVVKLIGVVVSFSGSCYLGIKWAAQLFDKKGSMIIEAETVTITKGGKEIQIYLHDIKEVDVRIFASYGDRKEKKGKLLGPMYVEYIVVTEAGILCESCSVLEGWEKMDKKLVSRESFQPEYTIDIAYRQLEKIVKEKKREETVKITE